MVGQPAAGDAGNARFHQMLCASLVKTAASADHVTALVAYPEAGQRLDPAVSIRPVSPNNVARLTAGARRALDDADAAIFSYVTPLTSPCPTIVVVHDIAFRHFPAWFSTRTRLLLNAVVPRSIRRAARVATVSDHAKGDIVAAYGVDPDRVDVITNVPAPVFTPRSDAAERVRAAFGLTRFCLYVGDVHPRKNLGSLAAALATLDGSNALDLVVVGRVGHRGREILAGLDATILGAVDDDSLACLYSAATVTCYPSLYEGFGLPVIEAMACGCPVVASNRGAIPEVAGDAALLTDPSPNDLAAAIRAAQEPATADRLRQAGPRRAARFTSDAMGEAAWRSARSAT